MESWLGMSPAWECGVGPDGLLRSFPASAMLVFCENEGISQSFAGMFSHEKAFHECFLLTFSLIFLTHPLFETVQLLGLLQWKSNVDDYVGASLGISILAEPCSIILLYELLDRS